MSLGQLTANYADSDAEEDLSFEAASEANVSLDSKAPDISLPLVKSPQNDANTDENMVDTTKEKSAERSVDNRPSPMSSPPAPPAGLSGVIIDDDEDDVPPHSSPPHSRVEELRANDGGSDSNPGSVGSSKNTPVKKMNRLVSYYNEEDAEDTTDSEEEPDEVLHSEPMDTGTDGEDDNSQHVSSSGSRNPSHPSSPHTVQVASGGAIVINGIKLPPAPQGKKCPQALQEKITRILSRLRRGHKDYNSSVQNNKEFRNPSIYEKLVDHLRLDENGTNYPVSLYDPHCWGKESFYEELAKVQKEEMEKREKERKERTKVDFMSGTKKSGAGGEPAEETKKRKSRFDAGRPEGSSMAASVTKPVTLVSTLPTAPKTTIDAFGSLAKKVKS